MKRSLRCLIPLLVICMFPIESLAQAWPAITLDVTAYVDGRDRLIVKGGTLQWHHFDYAAVGRLDGANAPTTISTTLGGTPILTNYNWIPNWPLPPPDPIRFEAYSSIFSGLNPALPGSSMTVTLTVEQARGSISIVQSPSSANGQTLIVEFNDDAFAGATDYEALLTIQPTGPDVTSPAVSVADTVLGPPKQVVLATEDAQSGLSALDVLECTNCTAVSEPFSVGTNGAVNTTATKTNQSESSTIKLKAVDVAGNVTIFDPVDFEIQDGGKQSSHTVNISPAEHIVMIANGTPGVSEIEIKVNEKILPLIHLTDGEGKKIDIARYIIPLIQNKVSFTAFGPTGAKSWIVITQP